MKKRIVFTGIVATLIIVAVAIFKIFKKARTAKFFDDQQGEEALGI